MIDQVRFENCRVLRDVTIDFERFTVLVGPNASGKTSVLRSLAERGIHPGPNPGGELTLHGSAFGTTVTAFKRQEGHSAQRIGSEQSVAEKQSKLFRQLVNADSTTTLLQVDGPSLRGTSYHQSPGQRIEPTGRGLAAMLADLLLTRRKSADLLTSMLRSIVPGVLEVQAVRDATNQSSPAYRVAIEFENAGVVDAENVSEGTLIALAILLCVVDNKPDLLLVDDIDKGLHPAAQAGARAGSAA